MAVTGTALALGIPLGLPVARRKIAQLVEGDVSGFSFGRFDPLVWIEVLPDDRIRLFVPKAEMGQGIHTSLAQLAAEELEIPWEQLEVVHASTNNLDLPDQAALPVRVPGPARRSAPTHLAPGQDGGQGGASGRVRCRGHLLGRSTGDDLAALIATLTA